METRTYDSTDLKIFTLDIRYEFSHLVGAASDADNFLIIQTHCTWSDHIRLAVAIEG